MLYIYIGIDVRGEIPHLHEGLKYYIKTPPLTYPQINIKLVLL
jgi:hypothetical protein